MTSLRRVLLSLVLFRLAAAQLQPQSTRQPASISVPGFRVEMTYSPKAILELKRRQETVVVFGYTYGSPTKQAPRRMLSREGDIGLSNLHAEIQPGQIATIPTLTLDQDKLEYVTPHSVQVLVNIVSGRRSSPDNLLDCTVYQGPLEKVQTQTIPIHCKLIDE